MCKELINDVKLFFTEKFKVSPLLVFSPGRINIIGEHVDYNGGLVLPAAVDKGIVAALQKSSTSISTAIALDLKDSVKFDLENLKPSRKGSWKNYLFGVIVEIQKSKKVIGNFNIAFKGNIPKGAGMSSSAALENSIVFGLNKLFDLNLTKTEMILISQKAEHNYVGVKCGIMDQYSSMFGVKDNALLLDCKTLKAKPYKINFSNYQLMLINTNVKHNLSDSAYNDRRLVCECISKMLHVKTLREVTLKDLQQIKDKVTPQNYEKALYVIQEIKRTQEAVKAIEENNLEKLGNLIYASHHGLQHQYKVSCLELDFLVDEAKKNKKVLGARMMGGGFGGCTINLIEKKESKIFSKTVALNYKNKFSKECSVYFIKLSDGTRLVNN